MVLFVQGFNPNYFLVDNINAQLVQLHLRITASHIGGGDSICNHSLRLFYIDGTTKDFTSTNNGACMNSGSTEFIIPEQSKPFNKFQYFANEYYNTGYNVGCYAYLTFISAKEKRVIYT